MQSISLVGFIHLLAGSITLFAGFFALLSVKGTVFHRVNGRIFICFMLVLTLSGLYLSIQRDILFTIFLALLTIYSFLTGWATIATSRPANILSSLSPFMALCIFSGAALGGFKAAISQDSSLDGLHYGAFFLIAGIATCSLYLDVKYLSRAIVPRHHQLSRHIWRMGFSLFLSTTIFFFGNSNVLPEFLQTPIFLYAPVVLVVFVTAAYLIFVALRYKKPRY